jgi:hypothetical protein
VDGIDAAENWLGAWVAKANEQAARSVELSRRVADLTASAEGQDGAIRVTVGSSGQVTRLQLGDRVRELSGANLADEIMSAIGRAQAALSGRVAEEVQATVGADTETARAVIESFDTRFPAVDPEDEQ